MIRTLLSANAEKKLGLQIYALVRDTEKAYAILPDDAALILAQGDLAALPEIDAPLHYIVHTASPTASKFFVEHPVETVKTAVCGTMNVLELAREKTQPIAVSATTQHTIYNIFFFIVIVSQG